MNQNLLNRVKLIKVADRTSAGTSTITTSPVDMSGYECVAFFTKIDTPAANNRLKVQQGQQSNLSDAQDLAGTGVGTEGVLMVEVNHPLEKYVRGAVERGTSTAVGEIWAALFNARVQPVANTVAGTSNSKILASPAEGTA